MNWSKVADELEGFARHACDLLLDAGQRRSVAELARRIRSGRHAALLADEVGMGKTRIAAALIEAVRRAGGRSVIVLPPGLGVQWQEELRRFNPHDKTLLPLRSYSSFIGGFLTNEDAEGGETRRKNHVANLRDRRQQRELPEGEWHDEKVLMISHNLAAMRFPSRGEEPAGGWRRELLPNVARLVRNQRRNFMRDNFQEVEYVHASRRAARGIADTILKYDLPRDLDGDQKWLSANDYKDKILPLIGYGLGRFHLVIIDEAHRARGTDSSLSRILGPLIWKTRNAFCLGMTATPVELEAKQWIETLGRIGVLRDEQEVTARDGLRKGIEAYVDNVQRLRIEELDEPLTVDFEIAAAGFAEKLRPFVLRRDKRDDPELQSFQDRYGDYRAVIDVPVSPETDGFTRDWLRRFCAAEALSLLPQDDPGIKRVRLSVAQAHGFGMDLTDEAEAPEEPAELQRTHAVWLDAFNREPADLYSHPAILAAVRLIEDYTARGEKVLVFGRFLKPMGVLTRLLDAREMLRRLRDGKHWPARGVPKDNVSAVDAATRDRALAAPEGGIDEINRLLAQRYDKWSKEREAELKRLRDEIAALDRVDDRAVLLAHVLQRDKDVSHSHIGELLESLSGRRDVPDAPWTGGELLTLFKDLLAELAGEDEDKADEVRHETLAFRLDAHLRDYSGSEGKFARRMFGGTAPQTRRLLQAAFNRPASWPMVLIAQSRVGREGLNLHGACRTVVLLHAEWNPGVIEQQIGRVDRKNSRWLQDVQSWQESGAEGEPPRIRIHPVVVSGTYDDHNWQVLKARWLELRAQLHGDVLPHLDGRLELSPEKQAFRKRIKNATPSFTPRLHDGASEA